MRICPDCFGTYPTSSFPKRQKRCQACHSAACKAWYKKNKAKHKAKVARWRDNNAERVAAYKKTRHYLLQHAPGGVYEPARRDYQQRKAFYGGMCAYCGVKKADSFDHAIPLGRGGSNFPANIYPCCKRCNQNKGRKLLHKEWTPPIHFVTGC